jgi:hypothetical protein
VVNNVSSANARLISDLAPEVAQLIEDVKGLMRGRFLCLSVCRQFAQQAFG